MIYLLSKLALKTCQKKLAFNNWYIVLDILWLLLSVVTIYLQPEIERSIVIAVLLLILFIICITDFNFLLIPDAVLYFIALAGILNILIGNTNTIQDSLIGSATAFILFYGIAWLGKNAFKKDAMGGGDIKLAAVLGLFIGWQGILPMLFIGSFTALIAYTGIFLLRNRSQPHIPFGPFITLGSVFYYIYGEKAISLYLDLL